MRAYPLPVPRSPALQKYEQVIKRLWRILPSAQWHGITKQLLGKGFGTRQEVPLPGACRKWGSLFKNQSLSSRPWKERGMQILAVLVWTSFSRRLRCQTVSGGTLTLRGLRKPEAWGWGSGAMNWRLRRSHGNTSGFSKSQTNVWKA